MRITAPPFWGRWKERMTQLLQPCMQRGLVAMPLPDDSSQGLLGVVVGR